MREPPVLLSEPIVLDGTEAQLRARLEERLCVVGELWLPTRGELKRWGESPAPLYLRWTKAGGFEIGPRMETMPAARLAPTLRGGFRGVGADRIEVHARLAWPRLTRVVLAGFALALAAWGIYVSVELYQGTTHLGWLGAWLVSSALVFGGAAVAWQVGRRQLVGELAWLRTVLTGPLVEGEDW